MAAPEPDVEPQLEEASSPPPADTPLAPKSLVDVHTHLLPFDDTHGCYASPAFTWTRLKLLQKLLGLRQPDPAGGEDASLTRAFADLLARTVQDSVYVSRAVVLGMDGIYRRDGSLDRTRTHFYVPDDFVLEVAQSHPDLLMAGVSVSPRRPHALDALTQAAEAGAVLVKWLPNTQGFDPAHAENRAFFRRLVDLGLPLLVHVGHEYSVPGSDPRYGEAGRLRPALEAGVTVIAAHAGSSGLPWVRTHFSRTLHLLERFPNLVLDTSASIPNRAHTLERLARRPHVFDRLLFGSDYPVLPAVPPGTGGLTFAHLRAVMKAASWIDRHALLQHGVGIRWDPTLPSRVLRKPKSMAW